MLKLSHKYVLPDYFIKKRAQHCSRTHATFTLVLNNDDKKWIFYRVYFTFLESINHCATFIQSDLIFFVTLSFFLE